MVLWRCATHCSLKKPGSEECKSPLHLIKLNCKYNYKNIQIDYTCKDIFFHHEVDELIVGLPSCALCVHHEQMLCHFQIGIPHTALVRVIGTSDTGAVIL